MNLIKRYIASLLFLICLIPGIAKGQHSFIPLPTDSLVSISLFINWHEGVPGNPPPTVDDYYVSLMHGKDTIVNGKTYSALFIEYGATSMPIPPYGSVPAYFGEWIRQDTISKKVWYIRDKMFPGQEEIIYDFSLQVGDTITDPNYQYFTTFIAPYKAWVSQIDSIYWSIKHKCL